MEDDLWYQVVVRLLGQRDVDEEGARESLRLLEELAFHHRFCGRRLSVTFVEDTATSLPQERSFGSPRDKAQEWLAEVEQWELLRRDGSGQDATYEFPIPTLDEYFAARHLAARWAENDEKYRTWLPSSEGWWRRGKKLYCPNPKCGTTLPPFRDLLLRPELEETLLLMVGLLRAARQEELFLMGLRWHRQDNLAFKSLSRARYPHPEIAPSILKPVWVGQRGLQDLHDGLSVVGRARNQANLETVLGRFLYALRGRNDLARWIAAYNIGALKQAAVEPLIAMMADHDPELRRAAANALGNIAEFGEAVGEQAVQPLIALLNDEDRWVRKTAAYALGEIRDTEAVQPLLALLKDKYWDVRMAGAYALGKIGNLQAIPALRRLLLISDNVHVRSSALQALEEIERRIALKVDSHTQLAQDEGMDVK